MKYLWLVINIEHVWFLILTHFLDVLPYQALWLDTRWDGRKSRWTVLCLDSTRYLDTSLLFDTSCGCQPFCVESGQLSWTICGCREDQRATDLYETGVEEVLKCWTRAKVALQQCRIGHLNLYFCIHDQQCWSWIVDHDHNHGHEQNKGVLLVCPCREDGWLNSIKLIPSSASVEMPEIPQC